jgi:hypothetical protein
MPKCGTWFALCFAPGAKIYTLVKLFLASQQNIRLFIRKWPAFFNSVQIGVK